MMLLRVLIILFAVSKLQSEVIGQNIGHRVKRENLNNIKYECGVKSARTGMIAGGEEAQKGEFPW